MTALQDDVFRDSLQKLEWHDQDGSYTLEVNFLLGKPFVHPTDLCSYADEFVGIASLKLASLCVEKNFGIFLHEHI